MGSKCKSCSFKRWCSAAMINSHVNIFQGNVPRDRNANLVISHT